jgi:hypothetical protein
MLSQLTYRQFKQTMNELYEQQVLPAHLQWRRVKSYRDEGNGLPVGFYCDSGRFTLWRSHDARVDRQPAWEIDGVMNCVVSPHDLAPRLPVRLVYLRRDLGQGLYRHIDGHKWSDREIFLDVTDGVLADEQKLFVDFMRSLMGYGQGIVGVRPPY